MKWRPITLHLFAIISLLFAGFILYAWHQANPWSPNYSYFTANTNTLKSARAGIFVAGNAIQIEWVGHTFRTRQDLDGELARPYSRIGFHAEGLYFSGYSPANPPTLAQRLLFFYEDGSQSFSSMWQRAVVVRAPIWFVLLLCVGAPMFDSMQLRRAFNRSCQRSGNLCASCGYDLRATPNRCPECGAVPVISR